MQREFEFLIVIHTWHWLYFCSRKSCLTGKKRKFLCINHGHSWFSNPCLLLVLLGLLRFVETTFVIFYFKFQGYFKVQEDKKHRATYQALGDSEKKLQFFSARQIACRLLGSRGYLCQKVFVCCIKSLQYFAGFYFPCSLIIWLVLWHFWGPRCV